MNAKEKILSASGWLPNLLKGADFEYYPDNDISIQVFKLIASPPNWSVDTYQLESNFADVGKLLERLLTIRSDLWDIEELRERTALQYISMKEQVRADNQLAIAQAPDAHRAQVIAACNNRQNIVDAAVAALESRHATPGSALNYEHRIEKLKSILAKDIESCFVRSAAVAREVNSRYAINRQPPHPSKLTYATFSGAAFLDDWLAWYRILARELELFQTREAVHEVIISLGRPQRCKSENEVDGIKEVTVQLLSDLPARVKDESEFEVNLSRTTTLAPGLPHEEFIVPLATGMARLEAIAIRALVPPDVENQGWRFNIRVTAPNASTDVVVQAEGSAVSAVTWVSPPTLKNRPARGLWKFQVLSAIVNDPNKSGEIRSSWPIIDLQLYLRVTGGAYV